MLAVVVSCPAAVRRTQGAVRLALASGRGSSLRCPTHAGRSRGLPSLAEGNPSLAEQWHPYKNGHLTPAELSSGCTSKVYWLCTACPCGFPHVWQSSVANRARPPFSGCPFCSGRKPCACRSLAVLRPDIAAQWDHGGNGELTPEDVTVSSGRKVQWACDLHSPPHTWPAAIKNRTKASNPTGCPLCSRTEAVRQTKHPSVAEGAPFLAGQSHPTKNGGLTPHNVTTGSARQVWWLCREAACGHTHEWQTDVAHRALKASGCPACAGQQPCVCNSLQAVHPQTVQAQWDWERNAPLTPDQLLPQSNQSVHWRCGLHTPPYLWQANPNRRFSAHRTGCPGCANARRGRTLVSTPEEQLSLAAPAAVAG